MRFLSVLQGAEAIEKFTWVPPGIGYYCDLSVQLNIPSISGSSTTPTYFIVGKGMESDILALLAPTAVERVLPDYKQPNQIFLKIIGRLDKAGAVYDLYVKHFGRKRLYVNEETDLMNMFFVQPSTDQFELVFQGNFIPKMGSMFKHLWKDIQFVIGADFDDVDTLIILLDLVQAEVKITLYAEYATNICGAELHFRLRRSGEDWFADTVAVPVGDVLHGLQVSDSSKSSHGLIGTLDILTDNEDTLRSKSDVFALGDVREGDMIVWDMSEIFGLGSLAGEFYGKFELRGIVANQAYSKEGVFIKSKIHCDLSKQENIL